MSITRLPAGLAARGSVEAESHDTTAHEPHGSRPSEELADLYGAILIAVPLALFLRWLWP